MDQFPEYIYLVKRPKFNKLSIICKLSCKRERETSKCICIWSCVKKKKKQEEETRNQMSLCNSESVWMNAVGKKCQTWEWKCY